MSRPAAGRARRRSPGKVTFGRFFEGITEMERTTYGLRAAEPGASSASHHNGKDFGGCDLDVHDLFVVVLT